MDDALVGRIKQAMRSSKFRNGSVNRRMLFEFKDLLKTSPDADLTSERVSFLVDSVRRGRKFSGQSGPPIGNIYSVSIPYADIPSLVEDVDVAHIEYYTR